MSSFTAWDFIAWQDSNDRDAHEFLRRMKAGEAGNPENPWIAARLAFEAGVKAGKEIAIVKLAAVVRT